MSCIVSGEGNALFGILVMAGLCDQIAPKTYLKQWLLIKVTTFCSGGRATLALNTGL